MTKQQPKNWWDDDETVAPAQSAAPASKAGNWWDDDEDASAAKAPPASMAPAAKAPPASIGTGAASMGIGAGFANPARIVPISPLKPGASEYRPEIEGYKGKQFPTNWPKGMAAPPMPPQGYSWQDTGYSYDLRQDAPKDFVSMSPAQLRQMREEQAAAAHQKDLQRKSNDMFEMQDGSPLYVRDDGTLAQPVEEKPDQVADLADTNLGVRVAKNALNTAGPGTINAGLDMAEMAASNIAGGPAMRTYAALQNQQEQPRITFGAENASKPQPQDMRLRVPELSMQAPKDGWQSAADVGGQIIGYMATPGQATEAALKATGATNALMRFAPQGSSAAAKAGRYGARILNPIDDVAHAAAFGAATAEDGKTAETALQYATDPINYIGRPIASLLYRGGIALDSLGKRVTPEAIELERAMSLLNGPNPTAAQVQEAAQIIDRLAPADATPSQPTTSVPTFTRPQAEPPPVQPQAAAQAAPQAPPVQAGVTPPAPPQPPRAGPTMAAGAAGNPPGAPVAQAAQTPPPGTLTPSGNGVAVDSFNALPVKTREGVLRAMEASGMTRQQAFDAIRSLNDLPPDRANMFEFELIRRFGGPDQFPNLQANLTAMGSDFSMQTGRKGGSPQEVMNRSLLDQAQSEGEYLTRMAEDIFGEGKVATKQELDAFRNQLGGQYRKQLEQTYPGLTRLRSPQAKLELQARIDPARKELTEYLLRPEVMDDVPQWVRDQVMLQVSDDLRFIRLDDAGQQFRIQQNPELAPLLTPERTLRYSPQLWKTLVEMYPTQVAHSLQSAYRQAIDEAYGGISNAVDRTTAKKLKRMRGESRVRANAADPNKRGYGLLHLLEQASLGYKEIRQQFGDVVGAQKAADMPNTFFRIAKDEEALANFIDVYDNELTPLQQEAVRNGITTQIRQALKNKTEFTQPWELDAASRGNLPNLTAVSSQPFLEALPRVFGRDGERMADAIRLSRANIDNIQAINKNFASGTPKGTEIQKNARNLYENPSATNLNPIDATTSTLSGVGALSAMTGNAPLSAAVLGGAAARALYRAYKNGKSLTPGQREALAEWLFKPRRASDAAPPTTPRRFSNIGYAGNVLTGAGVGAGAAAATGQDPTTGAVAGALGGGVRAGLRAMRAERSIIKPPPAGGPRGGNRLRTGGNPPPPVGPAGAPQIVQNGWFGGGKKPPRGPKAPPGAGPRNAPVQTVTRPVQTTKMQVSELRTKNGSVPVEAEVFPDRGAVVMSPKWPSYDAMQLEDAISRQRGRLPTSLDRWESFASQNPQEAAMLESDIAAKFNKLAKSGQAPAYNLALFEDYNGKNIVDMVRQAKGDNQVVLRTKDGGDVAVVDRKWLAENTDRYPRMTWEPVNDRWPLRQGENYHIIPRGDRFVVIDDASKEVSGGLEFTSRRDALGWLKSETSAFSDGPSPTRSQSARAANDAAPPPASAPKPPPVKNGFGPSKLAMDEASRIGRAKEPVTVYRTDVERASFEPQRVSEYETPVISLAEQKSGAVHRNLRLGEGKTYEVQIDRDRFFDLDEAFRKQYSTPEWRSIVERLSLTPNGPRYNFASAIEDISARDGVSWKEAKSQVERAVRDEGFHGFVAYRPEHGNVYSAFDDKFLRRSAPKPPSVKNGFADNATGYGTAGGAIAGGTFARDTNGDGVIDANERAAGALGGAITGGIAGKAVGAGARRLGKAPPMRNALRGPDQATFGGVNAKTADRVALARAQQMEASGADRNAIWDETGWFKGVDGKWRFEIDDSGAKIGSEAALVFGGSRAYPGSMKDVLDHPELYKAYPEMADDPAMIKRTPQESGVFEGETRNSAAFGPDLESVRSTMLHEAGGHGVQQREGFASGGSPNTFTQQKDAELARDAMNWRRELAAKRKEMPKADWIAVENAVVYDYQKNGIMDWLPSEQARNLARDTYNNPDDQLQELVKVYGLDKQVSTSSPMTMYRRTAGEAEARNVQTRDAMRRRGEKPGRPWETQDVPDDQQIVRFGGGKAESRKPIDGPDAGGQSGGMGSVSNPRAGLPNVRGGWSMPKIQRLLKSGYAGSSASGKRALVSAAKEFDSPEDLAQNIYYHGSASYIDKGIKPGAALPAKHRENFGGGYGEIQHTISLSSDRNMASNFTSQSDSGTVYPVILRKGAKVIDRPDLSDAIEVEDELVKLWDDGVDAVRIGDHTKPHSEKELVVLNPRALVKLKGEGFAVFKKKRFENLSPQEIDEIWKMRDHEFPPTTFRQLPEGFADRAHKSEDTWKLMEDALGRKLTDEEKGIKPRPTAPALKSGGGSIPPTTAVPTFRKPPVQNGFSGSKPPPAKRPPKVILEKRVANRLGKMAPALSEKTREAIRANAGLPPAMRKSAYEASGYDPALIEVAAPFMTGRAKDVRGKAPPLMPKPKNRLTSLDRGVHSARANAARAPDYPPLDSAAELRYRTENARRGAKSAVTRWENENYDFDREAAGLPQRKAPADRRQRLERQAETAALADRMLKQMKPTADDVEWLQRKATRRLREIDDAIQRGQMSPDFATAKPRTQAEAKDMARMIFEAEYADLLDDVLSGRVTPKPRSEHALAVFLASSASVGAVGGAFALADINSAADRQRQARDAAKAAKEEDMSVYREPTDPRFVWDWEKIKKTRRAVQTIQANLNALPPNKSGGRFNLSIDAWGPKTEAAVKRWQFENGFKPTGELTKEQWDLLDQQATEARQTTR